MKQQIITKLSELNWIENKMSTKQTKINIFEVYQTISNSLWNVEWSRSKQFLSFRSCFVSLNFPAATCWPLYVPKYTSLNDPHPKYQHNNVIVINTFVNRHVFLWTYQVIYRVSILRMRFHNFAIRITTIFIISNLIQIRLIQKNTTNSSERASGWNWK
jgi:hypothetical protein